MLVNNCNKCKMIIINLSKGISESREIKRKRFFSNTISGKVKIKAEVFNRSKKRNVIYDALNKFILGKNISLRCHITFYFKCK